MGKERKLANSSHMVRQPRCVFINYNWINQLSNTTIWWLDICCLLHRYQLHVSALMAIFRLMGWQQNCKQLYFGMRLVYGGGGLGSDGGTRSCVCWVGSVMWVHAIYQSINLKMAIRAETCSWYLCNKQHISNHHIAVLNSWLIQL